MLLKSGVCLGLLVITNKKSPIGGDGAKIKLIDYGMFCSLVS